METLLISDIKVDSRLQAGLFLDENFLLLPEGCPFSSELQKALFDWGFKNIFSEKKVDIPKPVSEAEKEEPPKPIRKMDASEFEEVSFDDFDLSFGSSESTSTAPKKEAEPAQPTPKPPVQESPKPAQQVPPAQPVTPAPKPTPAQPSAQPRPAGQPQAKPQQATQQARPVQQPVSHAPQMQAHANNQGTVQPLNLQAGNYGNMTDAESQKLEETQKFYNEYLEYTTKVYTRYATHKELNLKDLSEKMKELSIFIQNNKKYVLRLTPDVSIAGKDFLISHALRSAVFSIVIGLQLNLPFQQIVELGVTALLHEIGQIRLPPQLYLNPRALSPNERAQLATHTLLGYNILKENNFPPSMQLGVLEHHERENGTGYPRHLKGPQISLYAKIISVVCSFEAITSPRNYKASKNPFEAMVEMLQNNQKQYDESVIKALLFSVSLFPIGAYVLLSNGRIAQVTDTNSADPRNPIVEIVGMKNEMGSPLQIQIDGIKIHIVKVLDKKELVNYNIQK